MAVGDSITQEGMYPFWVHLYYVTRFPHWTLDFVNAGICGDSAGGGLRRYEWDMRERGCTVATIMFGMNDVLRELYDEEETSAETASRRAERLAEFGRNLEALTRKLKDEGSRIVLITPSTYDETALRGHRRQFGVNAALGQCSTIVRALSRSLPAGIVDLHGPMTRLTERLQTRDPSLSLIHPDRVHPNSLGHFIMGYLFLKGVRAPSLVSRVEVDAAAPCLNRVENANVAELAATPRGIAFSVTAHALPYPLDDEAAPALDWVPFHEDLSREILCVHGLREGRYTLLIDGQEIGVFEAAALASGVNLATEQSTPQAGQAREVLKLLRKWHEGVSRDLRILAQTEHWHLGGIPRQAPFDAVKTVLLQELDRVAGSTEGLDCYNRGIIERYLEAKPREKEIRAMLDGLLDQVRKTALPRTRRYELRAP